MPKKIKAQDMGVNFTMDGKSVKAQPAPRAAQKQSAQPSTAQGPKAGKKSGQTTPPGSQRKATTIPAVGQDTIQKPGVGNRTQKHDTLQKGRPKPNLKLNQTNKPRPKQTSPSSQIDPPPELNSELLTQLPQDGLRKVPPAQRQRNRVINARNKQINSRDTKKQNEVINKEASKIYGKQWHEKPIPPPAPVVLKTSLNNKFKDLENLETLLIEQLKQAPVQDTTSGSTSEGVVDPNNALVKPHEGESATTRIMGNFVIKGILSQHHAEVEWVGSRLMQASGENTPDVHMASTALRERIIEVDPAYKQPETETIKGNKDSEAPEASTPDITDNILPCLVMPRIFGSDLSNIVEDKGLRASLKENMNIHIKDLARIAFKDMILGNSDRIFRMHYGYTTPPYLPTLETIEQDGSPMNLGNTMFQTVNGEVIPHSAVAIDNLAYTVNDLHTEEGQQHELTVFQYYMEDVKNTVTRAPAEVLQENHVISNISKCLKKGIDSNFSSESLFTMSEEEMISVVTEGVLLGWNQVNEHTDALQKILAKPITAGETPTEDTLAFMDTVSKKLALLKDVEKPNP